MYLLDTNVCIRFLTNRSSPIVARLRACKPAQLRLCSVVKAELEYGARKSERVTENLETLRRFFGTFLSVPFDDACAEAYGLIRADLSREGTPIGPNDLLIAAIAKTNDFVLVTHNTAEFSRVIGLRLEDWESAV